MKRRRKRYRSGRRQRPSRTRRIMKTQAPVWLSIMGLLCGLQPATPLPWGKGGKWYNLTSPIRRAADERGETYWAVARGVPSLRIMGWGSQTVPLKLHGNATIVLGLHEHGTLPIPMERPLKKPLTLLSITTPICVVARPPHGLWPGGNTSSSPDNGTSVKNHCIPLEPYNSTETPRPIPDLNNHTAAVNLSFMAIEQHPPENSNSIVPLHSLPPCPIGHRSQVFIPTVPCSTGIPRLGPLGLPNNTELWFWDGQRNHTTYTMRPSPTPVALPYGQMHPDLWKIGVALGGVNASFRLWPCPRNDDACHDFSFQQWYNVFKTLNISCHQTKDGTDRLCYRLSATAHTPPDALFLLCPPANLTIQLKGESAGLPLFNITCTDPIFTNVLRYNHTGYAVFLAVSPPYQLLPVKAEDFALSPADSLVKKLYRAVLGEKLLRTRRDGIGDALSLVNLAIEMYEEWQIQELESEVTMLASTIQTFITNQVSLWHYQQHVDSLLQKQIGALETTVLWLGDRLALMAGYMKLQCHYKYQPLCVLNLPVNMSQFPSDWGRVKQALQGAMLAYNTSNDIHQLDMLIAQLNNISSHFRAEWDDQEDSFLKWFTGALHLRWLFSFLPAVGMFIMICLFFPCILKLLFFIFSRSLEALKADLLGPRHRRARAAPV
ncbi:uncharacterized protein LOC141491192 [Macrotis lagotis]|uniref:uncharacterized protein LOC141491192 n=1 Tax=Macrotis lagotis TaxID=92651 RepID=UPI003D69BC6E